MSVNQIKTLNEILSEAQVERLRQAYDPKVMVEVVRQSLQFHASGARLTKGIIDELYERSTLAPKDRERCLITLLAPTDQGFPLEGHLYWGLMEGLSIDEIGDALLLCGAYSGINVFVTAGKTFQGLLHALGELVESGSDLSPIGVIQCLMRRNFEGAAETKKAA